MAQHVHAVFPTPTEALHIMGIAASGQGATRSHWNQTGPARTWRSRKGR